MPIMNKRVECPAPYQPFEIVEKPLPDTPPAGLVLKTHYAGICHSDIHMWKNHFQMTDDLALGFESFVPGYTFPVVFGHEVCGEIYSLGHDYKGELKVGDLVTLDPWIGCGQCKECNGGDYILCSLLVANSVGCKGEGGWQQYLAVPDCKKVVKVPDCVPMATASLLGCSALTTFNAVGRVRPSIERACRATGSASLLIIGAGGLGLWSISFAKAILPPTTKVFVADISQEKLDLAKQHGADETILWAKDAKDEDLVALTKAATGGINGSVDLFGHPSTVGRTLQCVKKGANMVLVGLAGGLAQVPIVQLALNDLSLLGNQMGSNKQFVDLIQLMQEKEIKPPPYKIIRPEEAYEAIKNLQAGKVNGRQIISFVST